MAAIRPAELAALRLTNQRLAGPRFARPLEVVGWFGAMQAQEYAEAKWSIGQRARSIRDAALDRALADGTLIRTHVLRPTWHFVRPVDVRWMLALTEPRIRAMMASYNRTLGLDPATFAKARRVLVSALEGGRQLTRRALTARFRDAGLPADTQRVGHILMDAELDALICSGGLDGRQRTYALLDERVPPTPRRSHDEALAELTRRYFQSHGPATLRDYAWWSSLRMADIRHGVEMLGRELERLASADRTYWHVPPGRRRHTNGPAAHLLQGYDEYVVAYTESRDIVLGSPRPSRGPRVQTLFLHAIVYRGRVIGHWRRARTRNDVVTIDVHLFSKPTRAERAAIQDAAEAFGAFLGMPLEVRDADSSETFR